MMKVDLRRSAGPAGGDGVVPGGGDARVLGAATTAGLAWIVWSTAHEFGSAGASAVAIGLAVETVLVVVLVVVLVALVRRIDRPRTVGWPTALFALVWGGVVCSGPVGLVHFWVLHRLRPWVTGPVGRAFAPAVVAPVVEETAKVLAMVLGALSGIGFQVVENLGYTASAARAAGPARQTLAALVTSLQRAVGGIALSHRMFSACTGLAVGLLLGSRARRGDRRPRAAAAGLVAAALIAHGGNDAEYDLARLVGNAPAGRVQTVFVAVVFAGFVAIVLGACRGFRRFDLDPPLAPSLLGDRADEDTASWALVSGVLSVVTAVTALLTGLIWLVGATGVVLGFVAVRRPAVAYRGLAAVITGACGLALGFLVSFVAFLPLVDLFRF